MGNKTSRSEASSPSSSKDMTNLEDHQSGVVTKYFGGLTRGIWPAVRICLLVITVSGVVIGFAKFWTVCESKLNLEVLTGPINSFYASMDS